MRMRVDYQKLNQVMILIAAAIPDVASLLEQINIPHGTQHVAIDLGICPQVSVHKDHREQFAFS